MIYSCIYDSKMGPVTLSSQGDKLVGCDFGQRPRGESRQTPVIAQAIEQLSEYFAGRRRVFTVPLEVHGTDFQRRVWRVLQDIPYGQAVSYQDIARAAGNVKACRAVGMANNRNPISILIPCHRVIGKNGSLVGYGGGLDKKIALLALEEAVK